MTDQPEPADRPAPYEPSATAEPAPYEPPTADQPYQAPATAEPHYETTTPSERPFAGTPEPVEQFSQPEPFAPLSTPVAQIPGMETPAPSYSPYSPSPPAPAPVSPVYGNPYQAAYAPPPSNGLAIGALVCSILGFCTCLASIPGVIMGHIALSKSSRGEAGGRGMAIAALFLGYTAVAAYIGFIVTIIVLGTNGKLNH